ncbi:MAG: TIGR02449 family protein [Piscirickettsiaceae bacterium]|nr:TIGR02449 family protein [Piscirickettsiaceae bacterium]
MKKNAIKQLELQIDELLHISRLMYEENILLKTRQIAWLTERAKLVKRTDLARSRIETMLARLKQLDNE